MERYELEMLQAFLLLPPLLLDRSYEPSATYLRSTGNQQKSTFCSPALHISRLEKIAHHHSNILLLVLCIYLTILSHDNL